MQCMGDFLTWLLGYKMGATLLLKLITLHKENKEGHSILELLYKFKHKGRLVVDNVFGMWK
jgi:Ca2+-dependent lipid-binding protein